MSLLLKSRKKETDHSPVQTPQEEQLICPGCGESVSKQLVIRKKYICPKCNYYFRVRTKNRLRMVVDEDTFTPWDTQEHAQIVNPLDFPLYEQKVRQTRERTGLSEGVTVGKGKIYGMDAVIGVCDARFLMGSMGHVVGERIAAAVERATEERLPVILFCCSGGARMQEGIISLMQMAKTSAALKCHANAGLLYIPVLTDPTTGGVTASFAMLGDVILAEPGALIGFAGPRVIEQTIGQRLPEGFQRAEFQLQHGFVDRIVERKDLKLTLYQLLKCHAVRGYANFDPMHENDSYEPTELMRERASREKEKSAWEKVREARQLGRLQTKDYLAAVFDDFMELHGDRYFRDDPAIIGGIAWLDGQPVTVIGIQKGSSVEECAARNYGMPSPEGYRKALRLMKQAEKFGRPIITFVNTSGAYPGMEAEENGQGEAIARNLYEMSDLHVPTFTFLIGEGGSGGALALAVSNEVWMLEHAVYSILSPEGFASILWKDGRRAKEAASVMKITAQELYALGVIDGILPEFGGANQAACASIARAMKRELKRFLKENRKKSGEELAAARYERFRKF